MNKKILASWALSLFLIGMGARFFLGGNDAQIVDIVPKIHADAQMKGILYKRYTKEGLIFQLKAQDGLLFQNKKELHGRHVDVFVFKDHRPVARLKSNTATFHIEDQWAFFNKDVRLHTGESGDLFTEELTLDTGKKLLHSSVPVLIRKDGLTITGSSLDYHIDTEKMTIKNSRTKIK